MHLATPFITVLFSYFALNKLRFRGNKHLAVGLFILLVCAVAFGAYVFVKHAYIAVPKIVMTTVPSFIEFARDNGIELPFSDYDSLKLLAKDAISEQLAGIGQYARVTIIEIASFVIGLVAAVSLFLDSRYQLEPEKLAVKDNIYSMVWSELSVRFSTFYQSFATVMGAQMAISLINTAITACFLVWNGFPFTLVIIVVTFLCGLMPIIGNLMSNTLIVGIAFTLSPKLALISLIFLIALHKLEYFLNSKIIGDRIKNPMWLTLLGLIIGETLMGVPGMILAPVVLHYIKVEASKARFPASPPTS
jgi:predicted PurR-regulated permease PerM